MAGLKWTQTDYNNFTLNVVVGEEGDIYAVL